METYFPVLDGVDVLADRDVIAGGRDADLLVARTAGGRPPHPRSRANARRALSKNHVKPPPTPPYGELSGTGTSEKARSFSTRYVAGCGCVEMA